MAGEVLVTFGLMAGLIGLVGLGLIGVSKVYEPIERRRIESARKDWVEKYGESGRR